MDKKPATPAPGTRDFRETTKLEQEPPPSAPEQMKKDKGFRETHALDPDQHEG